MADLRTKDAGAQLRALTEKLEVLTGERTRNPGKSAVTKDQLAAIIERVVGQTDKKSKSGQEALAEAIEEATPDLTQEQAEAATGPDSEVFGRVSGQRLAQSFDANEQQIGIGQTWQAVSASRAHSTAYQNTTGRPILVAVQFNSSSARPVQVSQNGSTWIEVFNGSGVNAGLPYAWIVPAGWLYRINGSGSINSWSELR